MKRFNLETQEWEEDDTPKLDALGYLQSIYQDPSQPDARRMKAAIEALPFEKPKLAALATISHDGYADRLDKALEASRSVLIEAPKAKPPNGKSPQEVSSEHMTKSFSSPRKRF